jgi:hypothetical protein
MAGNLESIEVDYAKLKEILDTATTDTELFKAIVNAPFQFKIEMTFLFLGIVVLLQVNKATGKIDRVALSNTELAKNTTDVSYKKFHEIKIPLSDESNIIAKAIQSGESQETDDWQYLFTPALTPEQARINQASGGIAYSAVYPLKSRDGGALIFSYFQYSENIGPPQHQFMEKYTALVDDILRAK